MTLDELVSKYSKIFTMERYPAISSGWIPMLDLLCDRLQTTTDNEIEKALKENEINKDKPDSVIHTQEDIDSYQICCSQCKEKFGGLRFYTYGGVEKHHDIIHEYEILSYHICENCSTMIEVGHTHGWISTVCKNCSEKEEYKKRKWEKNI